MCRSILFFVGFEEKPLTLISEWFCTRKCGSLVHFLKTRTKYSLLYITISSATVVWRGQNGNNTSSPVFLLTCS